jgi:AcrR family transcriptional regulator
MQGAQASLAEADAQAGLSVAQRGRREAIVAKTIELLATREPAQIHMREIAAEAGVALATLYRYFPSKELLYAHAVAAWGKSFAPMTRSQAGKAGCDAERIRGALRRTAKAYQRWPNFYRLILFLEITEDREAGKVYQAFSTQYQGLLATVLEDTEPEDATLAAEILLSSLGSALRKWSLGQWTIEQVLDHIDRAVTLVFGQPRPRT